MYQSMIIISTLSRVCTHSHALAKPRIIEVCEFPKLRDDQDGDDAFRSFTRSITLIRTAAASELIL